MPTRPKLIDNPVRRFDFVQKLEWFLLASVTMILVIRTQLWLTNYPQLGGGGLHIAHLLYGGIFMLIAIWVGLIYLNRGGRTASAIIGGIGFGFFIDELGKFITSDNNYFYKPAAGIIYIVFIILFLITRELSRRQVLDQKTALANAMAFLPATVTGEFRRDELEVANQLLDQSDPDDPRVERIRGYFRDAVLAPDKQPSRLAQFIDRVHNRITAITEKPNFGKWVIRIVIAWGVISLIGLLDIQLDLGIETQTSDNVPVGSVNFLSVARALSILASVIFIGIGAFKMRKDEHQAAYSWFGRAFLVSIFVTRVFSFVEAQFGAVFGLLLDVVLYAAISELATQDNQKKHHFGGLGDAELRDRQDEVDGEEEKPSEAAT
ncbi:MAG: hypothetical protein IPK93_01910 [Solirubrobacterales bacterium]|nr:hypothetical protein [Solirubrobacterales bacterium]